MLRPKYFLIALTPLLIRSHFYTGWFWKSGQVLETQPLLPINPFETKNVYTQVHMQNPIVMLLNALASREYLYEGQLKKLSGDGC